MICPDLYVGGRSSTDGLRKEQHSTSGRLHKRRSNEEVNKFDPILAGRVVDLTRHNNLAKTILQGTLEGKRRRGRQKKVWLDNIKDWTSLTVPQLLTAAQDRRTWLHSCCKVCLVPQTTSVGHGTR
ncbi:hypothetical protein Bbelb_305910 [Branchiostoma belcheri]|nr:hypothetical protein Bbelb_305910 [Branchiostoma belcheri]